MKQLVMLAVICLLLICTGIEGAITKTKREKIRFFKVYSIHLDMNRTASRKVLNSKGFKLVEKGGSDIGCEWSGHAKNLLTAT